MEESSMDHCDTELCLSPVGVRCHGRRSSPPNCSANSSRVEQKAAGKAPQQQREQRITIFYNGQICSCDVTEIQARAIISMANREISMDKEAKKQSNHKGYYCDRQNQASPRPPDQAPPPAPPTQQQMLNRSLSMKRSLQMFLQKRKTRSFESSPYESP